MPTHQQSGANPPNPGRTGALGLPAMVATAVGVVVVQSTMISMLNGASIGGINFLLAIGISALLALSYVLSFAELSLMLPRSGSVSAYTEAALGPGLAIVATLSGYVAVALLGIPAELVLVDTLLEQVAPGFTCAASTCLPGCKVPWWPSCSAGSSSSAWWHLPAPAVQRLPPASSWRAWTSTWRSRWWRWPFGAWSDLSLSAP
jgi:amino acid transporter